MSTIYLLSQHNTTEKYKSPEKNKIHQLSWWFCFFGHSPNTTGYTQVCMKTTCQSRIRYLLPVNGSLGSGILNWSIFLSSSNCLLYTLLLLQYFPCCIYIIPSTPKLLISVRKFHISPPLKYHQTTFPFEISHKSRNRELRWYAQQQMYMVWAYLSLYYLNIFPFA